MQNYATIRNQNERYWQWLQGQGILPDTSERARREFARMKAVQGVRKRFSEGDAVYHVEFGYPLTVGGCCVSLIEGKREYSVSLDGHYVRDDSGAIRWFPEDELYTIEQFTEPETNRQFKAKFRAHLLAWFVSDRRYYIDHYVAVTPRYVLWRLLEEAKTQVTVLDSPIMERAA